jgi:hypothetical protein
MWLFSCDHVSLTLGEKTFKMIYCNQDNDIVFNHHHDQQQPFPCIPATDSRLEKAKKYQYFISAINNEFFGVLIRSYFTIPRQTVHTRCESRREVAV